MKLGDDGDAQTLEARRRAIAEAYGFQEWQLPVAPMKPSEFFGLDRSQTPRRFIDTPPPPTWRERLYRAWKALMGKW